MIKDQPHLNYSYLNGRDRKTIKNQVNEDVLYRSASNGYILIDVLIAIFIFAFGFVGVYALTEEAIHNTQSSMNLSQAVSLAQAKLEVAGNAFKRQRLINGYVVGPGERIEGAENTMTWVIDSEWTEVPNLLKVTVEIHWDEYKKGMVYGIESIFYIPSSYP